MTSKKRTQSVFIIAICLVCAVLGGIYQFSGTKNSKEQTIEIRDDVLSDKEKNKLLDDIPSGIGREISEYAINSIGSQTIQDNTANTSIPIDNSLFSFKAYEFEGIIMTFNESNTAADQAQYCCVYGDTITVEHLKPGDLIFYSTKDIQSFMNITNVAIYVGNDIIVEASEEVGYIRYCNISAIENIKLYCRPYTE